MSRGRTQNTAGRCYVILWSRGRAHGRYCVAGRVQCVSPMAIRATMASVGAHRRAEMTVPNRIAGPHMLVVDPARVSGAIAPMPVRIGAIVPVCARVRRSVEIGDVNGHRRGSHRAGAEIERERRRRRADITSGNAKATKRTMRRILTSPAPSTRHQRAVDLTTLAETMAGYGKAAVRTPAPEKNGAPLVGTAVETSGSSLSSSAKIHVVVDLQPNASSRDGFECCPRLARGSVVPRSQMPTVMRP